MCSMKLFSNALLRYKPISTVLSINELGEVIYTEVVEKMRIGRRDFMVGGVPCDLEYGGLLPQQGDQKITPLQTLRLRSG